ncbi:hypothetical protein [Nocardioides sp. SR21]|uniref:hypothetical protein n=1 Tax=Nocardioides sp. SR21 TaxID=2919501 RepID=UPI001FAA1381|nr:hypothetical protein [Nocardioides sp. SR21]
MRDEFLTPSRAKSLRRLLVVVLGFAAVMVVVSVPLILGDDYVRFGFIVLGLGLCLAASAWRARAAVLAESPGARRLVILTAVLTLLFSVPLIGLFYLGLLTAITGVGLLFVTLSQERVAP